MENQQSLSQKMFRSAANIAELTFAKYFNRQPGNKGTQAREDEKILNMLSEAFLRGSLQTLTDYAQWLELSQAVQNVYE